MDNCAVGQGLKRGDLVKVLNHNLKGYEWTVNQVGPIFCQSHKKDFDGLHKHQKDDIPPLKPGWWVIAIDHKEAKGGFALATLPEEHLAPHACTDRCKEHPGRMWTG